MAALSTSAEAAHAMRALARLTPRGAKLVIAPALDAACGLGYDPAAIDRLVALDVAEHTELWQAGPLAHKPPPRLDHNAAAHLIVGTAVLLRGALRSATPARFLERALREEAHLPDAVVPLVMKAVDRARQRVERASLAQLSGAPVLGAPRGGDRARAPLGAFLPSYAGVRWRIDVVISSSALQRVLRPHLHMELAVLDDVASDGASSLAADARAARLHTFHCSVGALAQLRRAVAVALVRVEAVGTELAQMPAIV